MVHTISTPEELQGEFDNDNNKGKLIVVDFFAT